MSSSSVHSSRLLPAGYVLYSEGARYPHSFAFERQCAVHSLRWADRSWLFRHGRYRWTHGLALDVLDPSKPATVFPTCEVQTIPNSVTYRHQGVVTFVVAIGSVFTLPDEPLQTRWLTPEQRQLAHDRIQRDTVELASSTSTLRGLIDSCKDPRMWLFVFMQHAEKVTISFKNFLPTVSKPAIPCSFVSLLMCPLQVVKTMGFSQTITLVLTCPPYLIATGVMLLWCWSSGKYNERTLHICIGKTIAAIGFTVAASTMNTGARYFAIILFVGAINAVDSIIYGWVRPNLSLHIASFTNG